MLFVIISDILIADSDLESKHSQAIFLERIYDLE